MKGLIGLIFEKNNDPDNLTDYKNIIKKLNNTKITNKPLVIYNENYYQWKNKSLKHGGGNAFLRKYRSDHPANENKYNFYVLGIPTDSEYDKYAIKYIIDFINEKNIDTVIWCIDDKKYELGLGIFRNREDAQKNVKKYSNKLLKNLKETFKFYYHRNDDEKMFYKKYNIEAIDKEKFIKLLTG